MEIHGLFCWNWSAHDGSSISNSFPKSIIKPLTSLPSHQHASNDPGFAYVSLCFLFPRSGSASWKIYHQGIAAGSTIAINIYNHPQRVFAWIYFFKYTPTWDYLQSPAFIMIIIDHWGVSFLWPTGANPCSAKDIVSGGSLYEAGDGCDLRKSNHVILGIPHFQ